ncbi:glycosyltransferase family 2 protein [Georgenia alba]|uniref:Glycosyltransferase family 2 protein n=1 Tax=Georgenia alba TaxID=2233858 RepID=A0ABW2Q6G4_9MICO
MARSPRISVVVPARDVQAYVADALTSLTRQVEDPRELQVIVVDDASSDATGEIVARFQALLPGLSILTNAAPVGSASARNQGLDMATGRYVAFLDADDWLAPGHLSEVADALEHLRVDLVRVDHTTVEGRRRRLRRAPHGLRGVPLDPRGSILPVDERTMVDYPYAWAGMFDRALLEDGTLRFPDGLRTAEDRPWIWHLFLRARSYAVVDAPGICYRRGLPGSLSRTTDLRQLDILPALRQTFDAVEAEPDHEPYLQKLARTAIDLLSHHLRRAGRMPAGARDVLRAGVPELLGRIPPDLLAHETARMHPGRAWVLHGLLPTADPGLRYRPPARYVRAPARTEPLVAPAAPAHVVVVTGRADVPLVAAALDAGFLDGELVLLHTGDDVAEPLRDRFDRCEDLATLLAPTDPAAWDVPADAQPAHGRLLRRRWGLAGPTHLVVPGLDDAPGRVLAMCLHDATLTVCSTARDLYTPSRSRLPLTLAQRLREVWHVPPAEGTVPWLAVEHGVTARTLAAERPVLRAVPGPELAAALGYVARPDDLPWLRPDVAELLARSWSARERFDPRRLAELGLIPGRRGALAEGRRVAARLLRHPVTGYVLDRGGVLRAVDAARSRPS